MSFSDFTKNENNITEIQNAYLIHKYTKELKELNISDFVKKIGHEIILTTSNQADYFLDIGYKWNKKDYRIQFLQDSNIDKIVFPFFTLNDIKNKINNKIIMVEDETGNIEMNMERNKIINQYNGPIGDFYKSKNFGISISNLYSLKYKDFLFRVKIARKEAKESKYWLMLLNEMNSELREISQELIIEADALRKILSTIISKSKP